MDCSFRNTSGAIHSGWYKGKLDYIRNLPGVPTTAKHKELFYYLKIKALTVPAVDLDDKNVLCFKRESPKSQTYVYQIC